jgi:hypothetical protein
MPVFDVKKYAFCPIMYLNKVWAVWIYVSTNKVHI